MVGIISKVKWQQLGCLLVWQRKLVFPVRSTEYSVVNIFRINTSATLGETCFARYRLHGLGALV